MWEKSPCRARESPGLGGKIENKKNLAKEKGVPLKRAPYLRGKIFVAGEATPKEMLSPM